MSKIREINEKLRKGKVSPQELFDEAKKKAESLDKKLKFFVSTTFEKAQEALDSLEKDDFERHLLAGIPTAIKDNFNWQGTITTASSKMLEDYESPYTATVVKRMEKEKAIIIGKTNMDAFAHGSSTATSDFFVTRNPVNPDYYPGGSSGGGAAVVASGLVPYSLGSETAGSIKQPASWCGICGVAPTYGRLSRYGLIAMGSSLDRPGPLATTVEDCAILIDALSGKDPLDATSSDKGKTKFADNLSSDLKGLKIGLPKQYWDSRIDKEVLEKVKEAVQKMESGGAEILEIDLMDPKYSIAVYTIICRSEISSNLARLDGLRFGYFSEEKAKSVLDQMAANRGGGLGNEAKQRTMTGTYSLSAGYYDAYYKKAQYVRNLIRADLDEALEKVDVIIAPTSPTVALKIGDPKVNDPLFGELSDVLVEASAMSGNPSMNVPVGKDSKGLPIGMQIIGKHWGEQTVLDAGFAYEKISS